MGWSLTYLCQRPVNLATPKRRKCTLCDEDCSLTLGERSYTVVLHHQCLYLSNCTCAEHPLNRKNRRDTMMRRGSVVIRATCGRLQDCCERPHFAFATRGRIICVQSRSVRYHRCSGIIRFRSHQCDPGVRHGCCGRSGAPYTLTICGSSRFKRGLSVSQ